MTTDRLHEQPFTRASFKLVDEVCDRFEDDWGATGKKNHSRPQLEAYLGGWDEPRRLGLFQRLLDVELELRSAAGERARSDEYASRFPEYATQISERFESADAEHQSVLSTTRQHAHAAGEESRADVADSRGQRVDLEEEPLPAKIGRYEVRRRLGSGHFGIVYKAYDGELKREVAIKVQRRRVYSAAEHGLFGNESEIVAQLEHPHIVPVHDAGQLDNGQRYVVSQLIAGQNLADQLAERKPSYRETARLLAAVAEALHYAHRQKLVHRDIKPANILVDPSGKPYLADFGLALTEDDFGDETVPQGGTVAYMSPEQARREGHRMDGRSDIFSLGVVLYEMLTGERPFTGSQREIVNRIKTLEARPPRMVDDAIPRELERVCLKALAKRATERYNTARDMAEDLRHFGAGPSEPQATSQAVTETSSAVAAGGPPAKVIPKGLRAFDENDADFFLQLLPGPYDRDGLPEGIRFWKTRIEETDSDQTFAVGLIYGPSGCGKSSLVKAGLLPRLASQVVHVYAEATANDTETRLLRALRKRCPWLPQEISLVDAVAALRRGEGMGTGHKVLVVLDQFEQWLHAQAEADDTHLVEALRQCDGGHVQCVVMVRDDFWLATTRFMQELEVRLVEDGNSRVVDLFDVRHARSVLLRFGRAFGALPPESSELSADQDSFLDQAVEGLAQEAKVVCVRLALFADMMKGKPWTPATLKEVGGTRGLGVTFLEETFSADTAPPQHRLHQKAARSVLSALLPGSGTNIKGHMRSYHELRESSGYASRPQDFADLIDILDGEVRLVTPSDPEGQTSEDEAAANADSSQRYYQLTHDYLVPSLRAWLTRKQRETRRGRAELRLAERAELWSAKRENQRLPSVWEYLNIRLLTDRRKSTERQQRMMRRAGRYYLSRTAALVVLVALLAWSGREMIARLKSEDLVNSLVKAGEDKVLETVDDLQPYMPWGRERLQQLATLEPKTPDETRQRLHAGLALVGTDENQVPVLLESLLTASPGYVSVIRDALHPYQEEIVEELWQEFHAESGSVNRRFRAGLALADYAPGSEQWNDEDCHFLTEQVVSSNPDHQPRWRECLQPISDLCMSHLEHLFSDPTSSETQLLGAANALAEFGGRDQQRIARLLTVANPKQYEILFPLIAANPNEAVKSSLAKIAAELPADDLSSVDRVPFGRRRAGAGITLLRLGERESVLPTFDMTDDPEALTQFIHRCREHGVRAEELLECLRLVEQRTMAFQGRRDGLGSRSNDHTRYALLLALAEYSVSEIPDAGRDQLLKNLADWYAHDPSSGVHSATGWLLRQWGLDEIVQEVDQTPVPYSPDREWFTLAVTVKSPRRVFTSETAEDGDEATGKEEATPSPDSELAESPEGSANEASENDEDTRSPDKPSANGEDHDQNSSADNTEKANDAEDSNEEAGQSDKEKESEFVPQTFYCTFIVFPAGEYQIGSLTDEPFRGRDETLHAVRITRPFALLDRELTFAELSIFDRKYEEFMQRFERDPVDAAFALDWYDAVGCCRWLTEHAGFSEQDQAHPTPESLDEQEFPRELDPILNWAPVNWPVRLDRRGFRLPTEAEWEVACRTGTRTMYGQGSDHGLLRHYTWYRENSGNDVHPPKTRRPGLRGLFDIHGNLWEWCHDWHGASPNDPVVDETGPEEGSGRVYRGGGWASDAANCRSSFRDSDEPSSRSRSLGFRLALVPSSREQD